MLKWLRDPRMICQKCGREAGPDARFCVDCGSPLEFRCPGCQTPYDPGSRFCSLCGRSLSEVASSYSEDQPRQPELSESLPEPRKTELQPKIEGRFQDDAIPTLALVVANEMLSMQSTALPEDCP